MTDRPTPSPAALAKADEICQQHGMLRRGYMATTLAEALEAYAARAIKERVVAADDQAERYERDLAEKDAEIAGLEHTLALWDTECGGRSPREFVEVLTAAAHALRSYQYGNASPDLAKEIADQIDAVRPGGTMLGVPITEKERQRISRDGP